MGVFAISRSTEPAAPPAVFKCHLNLWCLDGFFGRQVFFLDVGLFLRGLPDRDFRLVLHLPFETEKDSLLDLARKLQQPEIARVVFGGPIQVATTGNVTTLKTGDRDRAGQEIETELLNLDVAKCKLENRDKRDGHSVWTLSIEKPKSGLQYGYLRLRFAVTEQGSTWIVRRSQGIHHGITFDFRVLDPRGLDNLENVKQIDDYAVELEEVEFFLIIPVNWQARITHPSPKYLRILEKYWWQSYLGRRPGIWRKRHFVIFKFSEERVKIGTPFRVYCDFNKDHGLFFEIILRNGLLMAIIVSAGLTCFTYWTEIITYLKGKWLTIGGAMGALVLLQQAYERIGKAKSIVAKAVKLLRKFEHWLLSIGVRE